MQKGKLLALHAELVTIRGLFEQRPEVDGATFEAYDALSLTPEDINARQAEHKRAVFILGKALAEAIDDDEFSDTGRIGQRMAELADSVSV